MLIWVVFITGVLSLSLSVYFGIRYATMGLTVGIALALDKLVDVIDIAVTLTFSGNALATGNNDIDMVVASVLRLLIFVPSAGAGIFLWCKMKRFRMASFHADKSTVEVMTTGGDVTIEDLNDFILDWRRQRAQPSRRSLGSSATDLQQGS